jgi:outer membrane protein assembly factor BamB
LQPDDREIVIAVHGPPPPAFLDRLRQFTVGLILFGHWHSNKVYADGEVVLSAAPSFCFGGIDTSPRGYRLVKFGDDGQEVAFRASQKTISSPETPARIQLDGAGGMRLRWEHQLPMGLHRAAPVRAGDRILLSLGDEGYPHKGGVACVDAETGRLLWQTCTDASVKNSVAVSPSGSTGDDDLCVAVSVTGRVYAMSASSGDVLWESDLPGHPGRWIYTSPVIDEERVYAGAKAGYGAYSLKTGEEVWYTEIDPNDAWSCYASPQVYRDLLVSFIQRKAILALNRHTGEVIWERALGSEFPYASPVVTGDLVVTGGETAELHFFTGDPGHLAVLDVRSGDVVWDRPVLPSRYPTGLIAAGGRIYATTPDGVVLCCNLNTGDEVWRHETADDVVDMVPYRRDVRSVLAAPVVHDGHILVCGCDGYLYVLDAESGACAGRGYLGSSVSAAPCPVEGGICVGTYDGRLLCYDV